MKLTLVSVQKGGEAVLPLGLISIATYLKEKVGLTETRVIDANFQNPYEELRSVKADIIGISAVSVFYSDAIELAMKVREFSNAVIVIGGCHISTLPDSFTDCFDIGVIGEGEETMQELVELYLSSHEFKKEDLRKIKGLVFFDEKGKLVMTEKRELIADSDSVPHPDFGFANKRYFEPVIVPGTFSIEVKGYIMTSRGCPFKCTFCSTSHFWSKQRIHSINYITEGIRQLIELYGVTHIGILDDLFAVDEERVRQLTESLKTAGLLGSVSFACMARANLIEDGLCEQMKELGVKILNFGFESGSDVVLKSLKGGSASVLMNKNAITTCKRWGFVVFGSLMMGVPGEKIKDMDATLNFIENAKRSGVDLLWIFVATPYPGTEFWSIAEWRRKVSNKMDWRILSLYSINPLLLDFDVSIDEFRRLFIKARKSTRSFKFRLICRFIRGSGWQLFKAVIQHPLYWSRRFVVEVMQQ